MFLESSPGKKMVLCLLPMSDESAIDSIPSTPELGEIVESLVVVNDESLGGSLWGSTVQDRLGLSGAVVYATEPSSPIDRGVGCGERPRKGNQLPKKLRKRELTLHVRSPGVLEATWRVPNALYNSWRT